MKVWMVRGGYMGGWSLYDKAESYSETMLFAEINKRVPRFAYEANVTYQYDTHYDSDNLYACNVILHVFFETKKAQAKK